VKKLLLLPLLAFALAGCSGGYSFTGGDVGAAQTISIDFFPNNADLVQPQLSQIFTEALRDRFVRQTRLELITADGDMMFEGSIIRYNIQPLNAQSQQEGEFGGQVAQTRISVTVNVIFTNKLEPDKSFERTFERFADFPSEQELSAVEVELLNQISQELTENIFNESVGNW
jgi:hypothetical protein